jgi:hypothetical protein
MPCCANSSIAASVTCEALRTESDRRARRLAGAPAEGAAPPARAAAETEAPAAVEGMATSSLIPSLDLIRPRVASIRLER